ncbi:MAG: hypothetical protein SAMD01599839_08080 [Rectinema sp.]
MGPWVPADEALCCLWQAVHAKPSYAAHDMLKGLLIGIGETKCGEAMGKDRVHGSFVKPC